MKGQINLFEVLTTDEQVEKEFYNFFAKWDLMPLFTDEHRTGTIKVSDADARALINAGGAYRQDFIEFADILQFGTQEKNKSFQVGVFRIIDGVKSFQKLANNIREINSYVKNQIQAGHAFNTWNIIYYEDEIL